MFFEFVDDDIGGVVGFEIDVCKVLKRGGGVVDVVNQEAGRTLSHHGCSNQSDACVFGPGFGEFDLGGADVGSFVNKAEFTVLEEFVSCDGEDGTTIVTGPSVAGSRTIVNDVSRLLSRSRRRVLEGGGDFVTCWRNLVLIPLRDLEDDAHLVERARSFFVFGTISCVDDVTEQGASIDGCAGELAREFVVAEERHDVVDGSCGINEESHLL